MKLINRPFLLITLLSLSMSLFANNTVSSALSEYAWDKRQLIIFTNNEENIQYQKFKQALKELQTDIDDRNLHTWHIIGTKPVLLNNLLREDIKNQAFRDAYKVKIDEFRLILIGYDQGEKQRQEELSMERLFSAIDKMSMRIREVEMKSE